MKCKICGKEFYKLVYMKPYEDICGSDECFSKQFWMEIIAEKHEHTIINGECYQIGNGKDNSPFRGHSGRKFTIKKDNGEIIETTNLWYQGVIPKEFRNELKDNAIFV